MTAKFDNIKGFRLLDEGDLLEFWPTCAMSKGWLFLIKKNGWFDLESSRSGFLTEKNPGIFEYFISGENNCLSILSGDKPKIEVYSI